MRKIFACLRYDCTLISDTSRLSSRCRSMIRFWIIFKAMMVWLILSLLFAVNSYKAKKTSLYFPFPRNFIFWNLSEISFMLY